MYGSMKIAIHSCLILSFLSSLSLNCQNTEQQDSTDPKYPEVSLISTEKRILYSGIIKQNFEIYISLPYTYFTSDITYPVLFSLDANRNYGIVNNMVNILRDGMLRNLSILRDDKAQTFIQNNAT